MTKLSEHFSEEEFMCHCGCGEKHINPKLIELLERIRASFGKPITIMSGRRCEAHNTKVKGAKDSQHILGNAADIQVQGVDPHDVQEYLMKHFNLDCKGLGRYRSFTHIDVREGKIARWNG
jgi:uncharacterized protein YcbK (DUF882 family)